MKQQRSILVCVEMSELFVGRELLILVERIKDDT